MAINREDVLSYLETATMMEISELIKDVVEKVGVSFVVFAPVAVSS